MEQYKKDRAIEIYEQAEREVVEMTKAAFMSVLETVFVSVLVVAASLGTWVLGITIYNHWFS